MTADVIALTAASPSNPVDSFAWKGFGYAHSKHKAACFDRISSAYHVILNDHYVPTHACVF